MYKCKAIFSLNESSSFAAVTRHPALTRWRPLPPNFHLNCDHHHHVHVTIRHITLHDGAHTSTKMSSELSLSTTNRPTEERHAALYLPDGDIVISAPKPSTNASTLVLFRLDTLVLRCHSSIFKDMLSLPGDQSTNEQYDGVPRVRLTDDADDLAGLFKAMNNPA